jgi:type VI secretion system secreted protein VgrG
MHTAFVTTTKPTQRRRHIAMSTPLGQDALLLNRFTLRERLGALFEIQAELSSTDPNIDYHKVVGHPAAIRLEMKPHGTRFFHGHVCRFVQTANHGQFARYRATIVPWFWFLTRTSDCRVFQRKSVLDIAEEVFNAHRFGSEFYDIRLRRSYPKRRYCVQYRETDFNFISRLFESEGIYYWFDHVKDRPRLVIADDIRASKKVPGFETLKFNPVQPGASQGRNDVTEWLLQQEVQPVSYRLKDFDFKRPSDPLLDGHEVQREHGMARFAMYDYPGEYFESGQAKHYAQLRLEEMQARHELVQGATQARGLSAGQIFELADHPRRDQNRKYLITELALTADSGEFESGGNGGEFLTCQFTAIPSTVPYRPPRVTPKPIIQGIQTATVVGHSGKEVDPDDFGRVKIQFHWDRYGKKDENSSCWVRVSQPWAGKGFGGMNIPRIGQEVVVEFVEGDPDRPLINGRLYNAERMPHPSNAGREDSAVRRSRDRAKAKKKNVAETKAQRQARRNAKPSLAIGTGGGASPHATAKISKSKSPLEGVDTYMPPPTPNPFNTPPDSLVSVAMMSSFKSNSLGGSGGANELTMNDAGGAEGLFMKAQKDNINTVGNDRETNISNDDMTMIGHDRIETVCNDETIEIVNDHLETVGNNKTIHVALDRETTIGKDEDIEIGRDRTEHVIGDEEIHIQGDRLETVGGDEDIHIVGNRTETVEKKTTVKLHLGRMTEVDEGDYLHSNSYITIASDEEITIATEKDGKNAVLALFHDGFGFLSCDNEVKVQTGSTGNIQVGSGICSMRLDGQSGMVRIMVGESLVGLSESTIMLSAGKGKARIILSESGRIQILGSRIELDKS